MKRRDLQRPPVGAGSIEQPPYENFFLPPSPEPRHDLVFTSSLSDKAVDGSRHQPVLHIRLVTSRINRAAMEATTAT